jgi:hypothetical protein
VQNSDLAKLLDTIQGQIKTFDTKAQIALGVDGLLAGLLGNQLIKATEYGASGMKYRFGIALVISIVSFICIAYSLFYALGTVHPQLHLKQPKSHFFFSHLVELYGRNFDGAALALVTLNDDDVALQLGTQVQTNAIICDVKARRCRKALIGSGAALLGYLISMYPFASMAYEAALNAQRR